MSEETTTQKLTAPTGMKTKIVRGFMAWASKAKKSGASEDEVADSLYRLLAEWLGVSYEEIMDAEADESGPLLTEFIKRAEKAMDSLPKAKSS